MKNKLLNKNIKVDSIQEGKKMLEKISIQKINLENSLEHLENVYKDIRSFKIAKTFSNIQGSIIYKENQDFETKLKSTFIPIKLIEDELLLIKNKTEDYLKNQLGQLIIIDCKIKKILLDEFNYDKE